MPPDSNGQLQDQNNIRLMRIEAKIDQMTSAIVTLARVEEKIADLEERREEMSDRTEKMENSISLMGIEVAQIHTSISAMQKIISAVQRVAWIALGSIISAIAAHFTFNPPVA